MELRGGQLAYNIWIKLPSEVRHSLVVLFDIPRSGNTVVEYRATGAVVTSDGFTPIDIEAITLEKMQGLLGETDDNFYKLFSEVVDELPQLLNGSYKAHSRLVNEKGDVIYESKFGPTNSQRKMRFCDSCDSKGVRHKKGCLKQK